MTHVVVQVSLTSPSKLADWDDDDPQAIQDTSSRWDKVVILKHMFTLQELEVRCLPFSFHPRPPCLMISALQLNE